MKKFATIVAAALVACLALSSVASAAMKPETEQDYEAKIFAGSKPGKTPKKGSIGAYLHPFHKNTWPLVSSKKTGSILVSPPFATAYADVYLDKNLVFNPNAFPGCSKDKTKALDPKKPGAPAGCPKDSFLGAGEAAGFARARGAAAGKALAYPLLQDRLIASGIKNKVWLYTYSELSKNNIIEGTVMKASGKYGQKIRFVLPVGLISVGGGAIVSQLSTFDTTIPAKTYKGKALLTLKKCPKNKLINGGFQNFYSSNATPKPGKTPATGNDFVVTSKSKVINRTSKCK